METIEPMAGTTMRARRRTVHRLEALKGILQIKHQRDYSLDDVVWEALTIAYPDLIAFLEQTEQAAQDK